MKVLQKLLKFRDASLSANNYLISTKLEKKHVDSQRNTYSIINFKKIVRTPREKLGDMERKFNSLTINTIFRSLIRHLSNLLMT